MSLVMTSNCVTKTKRRNSEKRKEKSRKAARERRSQESKIFDQMEALLPIPVKTINHLDKASLVRLAINYLKSRRVIEPTKSVSKVESERLVDEFSAAKALNGFALVLTKDGDMVYLSEDVEKYLGLTQIDLIGQSIYDFSHPCDHNDIKDILSHKQIHNNKDNGNDGLISLSFFVRMKCTLTNKGRNLNLKSANYKVIHCSGHLKRISESNDSLPQSLSYFMTAVCQPIEQPLTADKCFGSNVFISRHSLDMKYTNIDESVDRILGYKSGELSGKSVFNFFHALDLKQLEKFFKTLFAKGQSQSDCYRFLAKSGGYLWLVTEATVITDNQSSQPQSVVCVNHVISSVVNQTEIVSEVQCFEKTIQKSPELEEVKLPASQPSTRGQSSYVSSTKTVFAPKTADMESGFIAFDNANVMTYLSDSEDLTHLAPEAGEDVCVPFPGLLAEFNDLNFFDEVFLNNNHISNTNLFSDEEKMKLSDESLQNFGSITDNSSVDDLSEKTTDNCVFKTVTNNFIKNFMNIRDNDNIDDNSTLPNDPFLSHNEDKFSSSPSTDSSIDPYSSDTNSPLNISSPVLSQTSNFFCKSPTEEVSKLNLNDKIDFIDEKTLEMRTPFIPIDDFPLILEGDLQMNYSNANIDDIIAFDSVSEDKLLSPEPIDRSPLMFESPPPQHRTNCLEALLQSNSDQKTKKINQKVRQNLNTYGMKSDILETLKKSETNPQQNRVQLVRHNINQALNNPIKSHTMHTNDTNSRQTQAFSLNSRKAQKNCFSYDNSVRNNQLGKASNGSKRPFATEPPDIPYNNCPNDIQKRFKINNTKKSNNNTNNSFATNKGNSVLMNLLVNGEDVTNGYSKYSNLDRNHISSNLNSYNNNIQKISVSKRNANQLIFEGQDIR